MTRGEARDDSAGIWLVHFKDDALFLCLAQNVS
jgi:hypothetical protein